MPRWRRTKRNSVLPSGIPELILELDEREGIASSPSPTSTKLSLGMVPNRVHQRPSRVAKRDFYVGHKRRFRMITGVQQLFTLELQVHVNLAGT